MLPLLLTRFNRFITHLRLFYSELFMIMECKHEADTYRVLDTVVSRMVQCGSFLLVYLIFHHTVFILSNVT